uniref:NADH dehydrogenase [ubiquinone] 1 beta subcomplex subunit 2, mitochondrial n=1 Tax=Cacopsylla melanoneura TaxID=428564 RepID=A0A8D8VTM9_9HEMI
MNKFTRFVPLLRSTLQPLRRNASGHHVQQPKSNSIISKYLGDEPMFPEKVIYRNNFKTGGWQVPKKETFAAEVLAGCFWWWVFWHLWHDWGHITGHYHPPDPSQWSDAELGIPPDDVE